MSEIRGGLYFITQTFVAGEPQTFKSLNSKLIHIFKATDPITLKIMGTSQSLTLEQGVGFSYGGGTDFFDIIEITSATDQEITFFYGEGNINDFRATFSGSVSASIAVPNVINAVTDISLTTTSASLLSSSSSDKLLTIITNPPTNANAIRVGHSGVTSSIGAFIYPGQTMSIPGSMAVYGVNITTSTQSIAVTDLKVV